MMLLLLQPVRGHGAMFSWTLEFNMGFFAFSSEQQQQMGGERASERCCAPHDRSHPVTR